MTHDLAVRPEPSWARTAAVGIGVGVLIAVAGLGVGWLWELLSPRFGVIKETADGFCPLPAVSGVPGFCYAEVEPEQVIAADGWFAILGLVAGVTIAVLVWFLLRRYRGLGMLFAIVIGSLVGALVAWWLGVTIGAHQFAGVENTVAAGARVDAPLGLHLTQLTKHDLWATGIPAVQALAAAFAYTMLAGFSVYPNLRGPDPEPAFVREPVELTAESDEAVWTPGGDEAGPVPGADPWPGDSRSGDSRPGDPSPSSDRDGPEAPTR